MYELVKQKSTGFRIVLGIIIFAFISAVLKIAFYKSPTTLNDDMIKTANEINSHAPFIVDSTTRLDRVEALPGNIFQYNYTLLNLDKSQIDTNLLRTSGHQSIIEQIKGDPKASIFKDNNIVIQAKYVDKEGKYVGTISIHPSEY
ncbi:MAG: hypothetical protein JNK27_16385 [Chitinophagaceae bacterium]|nr:hypothetical protein [Chitinophagaceae bacterium]